MPDFFPRYPTTHVPVFGSSVDTLPSQIAGYAAMDINQQRANVAGDIAAQQQGIANRNNFYQFARANEATDYNRQVAAGELSRRLATDASNSVLARNQYQQEMDYRNRALTQQGELGRMRYSADPEAEAQDEKMRVAKYLAGLGTRLFFTTVPEIVQATGASQSAVDEVRSFALKSAPDKLVSALNDRVSQMMLKKPGQKLDAATVATMKSSLPQDIQDMLIWSEAQNKWLIPLEGGLARFRDFMAKPDVRANSAEYFQKGIPSY
jgi:hypothetical protein